MNRRHCAAAAITLVCALAVLSAPAQAMAAPPPAPTTTPSATPTPDATTPSPSEKRLQEVREEIETLYRKAEAATDAYNLAEGQAKKQSGEIVRLTKSIAEGQARIAELKDRAGAQAREQYRNAGLPPGAQLVLSGDPDLFLDGVNQAKQGQQATKGMLTELEQAQEDLETYTEDASLNWEKIEANRVKQAKAKKRVKAQIAAAEKLESQLAKKEQARLLELERDAASTAQAAWLSSGALKDINREASPAGEEGPGLRHRPDRQALCMGSRGPRLVRLLRADLTGLGRGEAADPPDLAGAVAAAAPHSHPGHAPRRPDHLPQRRQPRRDVRRRRLDRARPPARTAGHPDRSGFDGDPGRGPAGQVDGTTSAPHGSARRVVHGACRVRDVCHGLMSVSCAHIAPDPCRDAAYGRAYDKG